MPHVLAQWGTQLRLYPQATLFFQWKPKPLHSASFLVVKQAQNWQEMMEDKGKNSPLSLLLSIGIGRQYTSSVTDIKPSLELEEYFPCTYCTSLPLDCLLNASILSLPIATTVAIGPLQEHPSWCPGFPSCPESCFFNAHLTIHLFPYTSTIAVESWDKDQNYERKALYYQPFASFSNLNLDHFHVSFFPSPWLTRYVLNSLNMFLPISEPLCMLFNSH